MSLFGDIFSIGSSLIGGKKSSRKDAAIWNTQQMQFALQQQEAQNNLAKHMQQVNLANQDKWNNVALQQERNKLQWLVHDARKAKLHPIYALGASNNFSPAVAGGGSVPGTVSPQLVGPGDSAGGSMWPGAARAIAGAVSAKEAREEAARAARRQTYLDGLAARESNARTYRDWAEAQLALSEAARARQIANVNQDYGGALSDVGPGATVTVPRKQVSASKTQKYLTAGQTPALQKVRVGTNPRTGKGIYENVIATDELGEAFELSPYVVAKYLGIRQWLRDRFQKMPEDYKVSKDGKLLETEFEYHKRKRKQRRKRK